MFIVLTLCITDFSVASAGTHDVKHHIESKSQTIFSLIFIFFVLYFFYEILSHYLAKAMVSSVHSIILTL